MKNLFIFLLFIFSTISFSATKSRIDRIETLDSMEGQTIVTFWSDNRVYWLSDEDPNVDCLKVAFQTKKPVSISIGGDPKTVSECEVLGADLIKTPAR